jgi:hypothetical protein
MNSRMQGFAGNTLTAVLNSKRVWLTQVVANALLLIAFFYWTRIPEATGRQFTLTVVAGLMIAFAALWLHSATFVFFSPASQGRFGTALRDSIACIPAFLLWTLIFGVVLFFIGGLWAYEEQAGGYARHLLPLFLRRAVSPRSMFSTAHWLVWFLYFFLWPILFVPVGAQVAVKNFRGFFSADAFRPIGRVRFWLTYLVCFLLGAYVPYRLAWMVSTKPSSLSAQEWSMALRLGFGYLLLVTAWLALCAEITRADGGQDFVAGNLEAKRTGLS